MRHIDMFVIDKTCRILCGADSWIDGFQATSDPFYATCPACIDAWDRMVFEKDPTSSPASRAQARVEAFADEEWDQATYTDEPTTALARTQIRMEMLRKVKP